MNLAVRFLTILSVTCLTSAAFAGAGLTLQGRILKADGNPLEGSNVQFKIQVRSGGSEDCLLFQETQALDMRSSRGLFSLTIGSGTRTASSVDGGYSLDRVFANRGTMDFSTTSPAACVVGTTFTPTVAQGRRLVYFFNDGSGWQTVPSMAINWIPQALESLQVGGYQADQLLRVTDLSGNPQTAPNLTPAQAAELMNLITGATIQYVKPGSASFTAAPQYSGAVSGANDLTNKSYVDAAIAASTASATLPDVGTAGTYTKVTTDAKGRVTAGTNLLEADIPTLSTAGKVSGTAINTGTIGGNAALNTTGNIVTSGTISAVTVSGNSLRLFDGTTNYISLTAPTLSGIVSFKLPAADGSAGQVLKTDGAGNLSWVSPSSGSVTSVTSGGAPISIGGTASAPTVSITQAGSGANGYLSSADWNTFNNKLGTASTFSGDVSGAYNSLSVDKIKGKAVTPGGYAVAQVLRYDGTQWVNRTLDFADLSAKPTTLAGYGITDAASTTLADGKMLVGNASNVATAVTLSGDATLSNAGVLTLNTVAVSKGGTGSTSFTANRLVSSNGTGSALQSFSCTLGQVISFDASGVAGCENVNGAGQVTRLDASSNLGLSASIIVTGSAAPAVSAAGKGQIYFDSTANKFKVSQNGGAYVDLLGASGTVTNVTASPPLGVTNGSTTPALTISQSNATTDGYLSSTDWNTFNNKQGTALTSAKIWVGNASNVATAQSPSGDVSLDNAGAFTVNKIKNVGVDFSSAPTSGQVLKYNGTNWAPAADSGLTAETDPNVQAWAKAAPTAANFDTTGNVLNLKDTTVTAGSYGGASSVATFTVDAKGRLTAASSVTVDDTSKLPLAGGTMTGTLGLAQLSSDPSTAGWNATQKGRTWFNTTSNEVKYWDGSTIKVLGVSGGGLTNLNGSTVSSQSFGTPGTTGTAPAWSTNAGTGVHTLNIPMASTASVTAGLISKTDYDSFSAKMSNSLTSAQIFVGNASNVATGVAMSGDATISNTGALTLNTVSVSKGGTGATTLTSNGVLLGNGTSALSATAAGTADQVLRVPGAGGAPAFGAIDLSKSAAVTGTLAIGNGGTGLTSFGLSKVITTSGAGALQSSSCSQYQVLSFDASGNVYCADVNTLSGSYINGGNSFGADATFGNNSNFALGFKTNNTVQMTITNAGYVGIGTTAPGQALEVNGTIKATDIILTSDARAKHDVESLDTKEALEKVCRMRAVSFKWNRNDKPDLGIIAQELRSEFPDLVNENQDGTLSVRYTSLISPLIASVQELRKNNLELVEKNRKLDSELEHLKNENEKMKADIQLILKKLSEKK